MYIDEKMTIWSRSTFNEEDSSKLREFISKFPKPTVEQVKEFIMCNSLDLNYEVLLDTEEELTVEQNEMCSTYEIFEDDSVVSIYSNSPTGD